MYIVLPVDSAPGLLQEDGWGCGGGRGEVRAELRKGQVLGSGPPGDLHIECVCMCYRLVETIQGMWRQPPAVSH